MLGLGLSLEQTALFGHAAVPTWQTMRTTTLNADDTGWGGFTTRLRIEAAGLTDTVGATQVRLTLTASTAGNLVATALYIGLAGAGFAFASSPTQVLVAGSGGFTIPQSTAVVSDAIALAIDGTAAIVIAAEFNSFRKTATMSNSSAAFKGALEASVQAASGYSAYNNDFIAKVEALG